MALAMAQAGDFRQLQTILDGLASDDPEVRIKAAYACQRIGFPAAIDPLGRMAAGDPESDNRSQAIYALAAIGRPAVVPPLIATLADEDEERREDAGTALYRVVGKSVMRQLANDEESGRKPGTALAAWWGTQSARFDPAMVYSMGELASPGVFIQQLKASTTAVPDAILNALQNWTGEDFGKAPKPKAAEAWEKWWAANQARYQPGHRYFYGHLVP